jgi:hypothetical protein
MPGSKKEKGMSATTFLAPKKEKGKGAHKNEHAKKDKGNGARRQSDAPNNTQIILLCRLLFIGFIIL